MAPFDLVAFSMELEMCDRWMMACLFSQERRVSDICLVCLAQDWIERLFHFRGEMQ
jgi:hypothetical protein